MKKIVLLTALVCAGSLVGMEPSVAKTVSQGSPAMAGKPEKGDLGAFEQLPLELRQIIAKTALESSTTIDQAIKAIQNASLIYGGVKLDETAAMNVFKKMLPNDLDQAIEVVKHLQGDNLKDFTKLAHILANHFNETTNNIAKLFNTPIARKYKRLGNDLLDAVIEQDPEAAQTKIIELINQGADVNFSGYMNSIGLAIKRSLEIVQLLLKAGAKPTEWTLQYARAKAQRNPDNQEAGTIKNLIEEAMKK